MADQNQQSSYMHDVFVSFKGEDGLYQFTDHLSYALSKRGINGVIHSYSSPLQNRREEDSKIAIVVLSRRYAFSCRCLEELSSILDDFKGNFQFIIPVFYDVGPAHLRNLETSTLGHALFDPPFWVDDESLEIWRHLQNQIEDDYIPGFDFRDGVDKQSLEKWSNALNQIAYIPGFHFRDGDTIQFSLIERIVERVCTRLFDRAPLHYADTVGLESPSEELGQLLELHSHGDVHMLGIYGDTGIGKTTLARQVYNTISHQFEASCFLPDLRENSNIHGLPHLQNMLLSEMLGWKYTKLKNDQRGSRIIKKRLHQKKVLLILDDVDKLEQLEALAGGTDWFGLGSRIIVTTQDRHLLAFHGIERKYEVKPLSNRDALELLSQLIFKEGNVDPSNTEILNELVTYAAGLPLALKVIGSYLFGKSVDEWTNALHQFKRVPPEDIPRKIKSSFDALREDEKHVFLDIACCFNGYESRKAMDILSAYRGPSVKSHIEVLIDRSLVGIDSDDMVRLHPLVEGMGKNIVRQESPDEPGKRSRLWHPEDIIHVLRHNMGTDHTEIIHLESPLIEDESPIEWDGEAFKKMENLKTLIIREWNFSKAPKYLPNSLRVLEWWKYPSSELPSDFNTEHLVIHNLPNKGVLSTTVKNSLDKKIGLWGKEMDIRLLLSTLHQVMWPKSDWEEISSMSLTESSQVKKAYCSALLLIHPDKLQKKGTTLIQKYIAENVFHILQSAMRVHLVSPTSQSVPGVLMLLSSQVSPTLMSVSGSTDPPDDPDDSDGSSDSSEEGEDRSNPPSDPEALSNTSGKGIEMSNLPSASQGGGYGNPPSAPGILPDSSQGGAGHGNPRERPEGVGWKTWLWPLWRGVGWETWFWRVFGTLAGAVGSLCFALSPPSKCSNGGKTWLWILCPVLLSLVIFAILFFVKLPKSSKWKSNFVCYVVFVSISVYSFFYDEVVDNHPSIVGATSNLAFALVALSMSELNEFEFDTGIFCYFLLCFTTQLMHIKRWLLVVSLLASCPLFIFHFFSKSKHDNRVTTLALLIQKTSNRFNETIALIQRLRLFNETLPLLIQQICDFWNETLAPLIRRTHPDHMPKQDDPYSEAALRVVAV